MNKKKQRIILVAALSAAEERAENDHVFAQVREAFLQGALNTANEHAQELAALLRSYEWGGGWCKKCGEYQSSGHHTGCRVAAALAEHEA